MLGGSSESGIMNTHMKIIDHFLYTDDDVQIPYVASPNCEDGLQPEYLVMHYTVGPNAGAAIGQLTNPLAQVSAHLVIGRDGAITQLVPFDRVAWHAGKSTWQGRTGLNRYSIGIELDNAGRLLCKHGEWRADYGGFISEDQVIETYHKNRKTLWGWHTYPQAQLDAALAAAQALLQAYSLLDVVGHDDVAPTRKIDPGPAFPMEFFRASMFGQPLESPPSYIVVKSASLRDAPNGAPVLTKSLPADTRLGCLQLQADWMVVKVLDPIEGVPDIQGWLQMKYVKQYVLPI